MEVRVSGIAPNRVQGHNVSTIVPQSKKRSIVLLRKESDLKAKLGRKDQYRAAAQNGSSIVYIDQFVLIQWYVHWV